MKKFWKSSYFAIIMLFIYIPIIIMIVFSFNSGDTVNVFEGFSGKAYDDFVHNSPFVRSIITSLFVAVISTAVSLVIGGAAAIGLSRCKKITQKSWLGIANIPLINADVVTAVSLMIIFLLSGVNFGIGTLIFAHISFNVPYVLITIMPRMRKIDKSTLEAAQDLGSKPHQILFKVILPILKPAFITAGAIAFAMSFDDFIISYFTGGPQTNVSTFIYTAKKVKPFIYAFGTLLVAAILLVIIIWNAIQVIKIKKKETEEALRGGYYKAKTFDKYYKKLNEDYIALNTQMVVKKTHRLSLWVKYFWLKFLIKIYSIKNYDKKISRLEWKQYKIRNEIRNEKRYYSRLERCEKSIAKKTEEMQKKANDAKRVAKISLQLDKLNDKKADLESEIEWIENRDEKAAKQAKKIQRQIDRWETEYNVELEAGNLSKKDITWYKKKIKILKEWKIEVEEGKNHYKLRMTTEKLRATRDLRNNKISELQAKLDALTPQVYVWTPITSSYDKRLKRAKTQTTTQIISAQRETYLETYLHRLQQNIVSEENKIDKLQVKVTNKHNKLFAPDSDDIAPKSKNWFQKSWKIISVALVAIAAFSGLTVAYVKNNIYDLTVANWGEYIDPELINKFEKETGYKVNYQTYDANETLYTKLYSFKYDLMVPSDYMVQRLANENRIEEIDWSKLNINAPVATAAKNQVSLAAETDKDKATINQALIDLMAQSKVNVNNDTDGGKTEQTILDYAVPYFWGDVVLVFNTNNQAVVNFLKSKNITISEEEGQEGMLSGKINWQLLQEAADAGLKVKLNNDPKNIFMIASQILYGKNNLVNKDEVNHAYDYLTGLIKNKNIDMVEGDSLITTAQTGQFDVAMMYSGDALYAETNRPSNLKKTYAYGRVKDKVLSPLEGIGEVEQRTNVYSDSMVVSKGIKETHRDAAYEFINFMYNEQNATDNSMYVGLASPVDSALKAISTQPEIDGEENEFKDYAELYKPIVTDPEYTKVYDEPLSFQNNNELDAYLVDLYNKLLTSINSK
ncbi:spermidine/putrescine ABC transporter permease/substrate-binding protein [Mesoplasma lactucae]|uniref:Spermidine/putrescine ABC transporter permease n=1 Tax=Mesoplasma lactucae ATCC 49193 TaxID=81460 RepID=A0A291IS67_9MOLU|nr:spermidine/putrescine ABC transporter permease/substrate-binding protein [Mesoplasma lactucae]ATG97600.1 spermidine/putrescine ABC transporter permease [Mesoplasma lactucae ATCC 49193]ATZ19940.1 spermidine/putrescine ABC transporter permease [Mesoplasma lactucae ATCC 49193]MCL8217109.1 hypothetical protein [Mesoplasma lactucae ATCC 49193]